ncbi:MAG: TIGR01777 family protein [Ignavibacteria bacterium]|nr:TIGR01777 family protein [Ignavibacteria bacterium]
MNVLLVGGSGFIGTMLAAKLQMLGHEVTVVSRKAGSGGSVKTVSYSELKSSVGAAQVVVNLAGANLGGHRWTAKYRTEIVNSRVLTTRNVVNAINASLSKPRLVSISGTGYYGNTQTPCGEYSGVGSTFLAQVCEAWEAEANKSNSSVTIARMGAVLDKKQGALPKLMKPVKLFVGAILGSGKQYLPWIQIEDAVGALVYFIENEDCHGEYNVVSPQPITHKLFMKTLGKILNRPVLLKIPELFIRLILGRMTDVVVHGQRAIPTRIQGTSFEFLYPNLESALRHTLK